MRFTKPFSLWLNRMRKLAKSHDAEHAHAEADAILCAALRKLGYERLVDAYEKVTKWYA